MLVFKAPNSTEMSKLVYPMLSAIGEISESRNGRVLAFTEPVSMTYTRPWTRGNNTPDRDANPFFHIAEAMWMLAGREDVAFLTKFNKNMALYSDDGIVFNAPYGYRLRYHFGQDQLKQVVGELKLSETTRQAVCQIWDSADLGKDTKDKACNMSLVFSVNNGRVDMMVYNRSNDLVYGGVTGANPVHMSYFQQWVADSLCLSMGELTFVVNNAHVYLDLYPHWEKLKMGSSVVSKLPIYYTLRSLEEIEYLCNLVMDEEYISHEFESDHLNKVVVPIINTWFMRKSGEFTQDELYLELGKCMDSSLFSQCSNWMEKRL